MLPDCGPAGWAASRWGRRCRRCNWGLLWVRWRLACSGWPTGYRQRGCFCCVSWLAASPTRPCCCRELWGTLWYGPVPSGYLPGGDENRCRLLRKWPGPRLGLSGEGAGAGYGAAPLAAAAGGRVYLAGGGAGHLRPGLGGRGVAVGAGGRWTVSAAGSSSRSLGRVGGIWQSPVSAGGVGLLRAYVGSCTRSGLSCLCCWPLTRNYTPKPVSPVPAGPLG